MRASLNRVVAHQAMILGVVQKRVSGLVGSETEKSEQITDDIRVT